MLPATTRRVADRTAHEINRRIRRQSDARIAHFAEYPAGIGRRLEELDAEWDIERTLETNAAALALVGTVLGATVDRRWLVLPAAVTGFLLQHALQGWCPPVPLFRRLGVRTAAEIERERHALKALRGDFDRVRDSTGGSPRQRAAAAINAVRA